MGCPLDVHFRKSMDAVTHQGTFVYYSKEVHRYGYSSSCYLCTVDPSLLALNGGGRFLSPSSPLSSLLCSLVL